MVIESTIIKQASDFINCLESKNIHINEAFIFGSHTKGTATPYSDIDLALVSSSFSGIRFDDNVKIIKNTPHNFVDIETHPFKPEDFSSDNPFVDEIIKTGYRLR